MQLKIRGKKFWLWPAVDQDGFVLDTLVQEHRNEQAAVLPTTEHRRHKRLNNRSENSHLPVRTRERVLQRFKSAEHAQRFLEPFSAVRDQFRRPRHRLSARQYREIMTSRFRTWREIAGVVLRP